MIKHETQEINWIIGIDELNHIKFVLTINILTSVNFFFIVLRTNRLRFFLKYIGL